MLVKMPNLRFCVERATVNDHYNPEIILHKLFAKMKGNSSNLRNTADAAHLFGKYFE